MSTRALAFRPLRIVPLSGAPEGSLPLVEVAPWPATPFAARVALPTDLPASARAVVLASADAALVARYLREGRSVVVEAPDAAAARAALKAGALGVLPAGRAVRMGERKIPEKAAPPARARPGPGPSLPGPEPRPAAADATRARKPGEPTEPLAQSAAIVGLACVFPGANGKEAFWDLVTSGRSAITEVSPDRWDPALHYDPDPTVPDKTYTKIGGFVRDFKFDPMRFRVPPTVAKQLDSTQQWALMCAWDALVDAGYQPRPGAAGKAFDRSRCAVILGNSMGGEMRGSAQLRVRWNDASAALDRVLSATIPEPERKRLLEAVSREVKRNLPEITEDTMPGDLSNVIAGRIANLLDLGGKNITTDAACASSLAAIDAAVRTLASGEADLVLCGGADRSMDAATYVMFCKIGALSPDGSRPFDAGANGFVMGEGAGILVLKRLADAMRDGDRVYAVVRAVGSSSDGKGKGITAPNPEGQKLALRRAYDVGELETSAVQLVEAHGTSTPVGDPAEVSSMAAVWSAGASATVALGSVKGQIGHLKSAAGAASLIKAALALHYKVLPPSINFRAPNPHVAWETVPFRVQTQPAAWPEAPRATQSPQGRSGAGDGAGARAAAAATGAAAAFAWL
ncbi:MAG TPA: polyketide synthase, partial [Candidatus Thermoplasmatota archaeon]|nr:polyketide synthase [Candidatus Thermoplasmatota archaeon]